MLANFNFLILFFSDNALLTQSRFILMESILIQFSLTGLLCIMKFRKIMDQPKKIAWWFWLTAGLMNLTCALWLVFNFLKIKRDFFNLNNFLKNKTKKSFFIVIFNF